MACFRLKAIFPLNRDRKNKLKRREIRRTKGQTKGREGRIAVVGGQRESITWEG